MKIFNIVLLFLGLSYLNFVGASSFPAHCKKEYKEHKITICYQNQCKEVTVLKPILICTGI